MTQHDSRLIDSQLKTALRTVHDTNRNIEDGRSDPAPGPFGDVTQISEQPDPQGSKLTQITRSFAPMWQTARRYTRLFPARLPRLGAIKRRHVYLACLVLIGLFRPMILFWTGFAILFLVLTTYGALGPEGISIAVRKGYRRFHKRRPDKAEAVRAWADSVAMRMDLLLDRLPESWVEDLYLPDFGPNAAPAPAHTASGQGKTRRSADQTGLNWAAE